jgi:hypothetical protein
VTSLLVGRQVDQRASTSCRLHHVAVLPHEFGHWFTAWITGIKSDPWDIEWGDGSVGERKIGIGLPTSHTAHHHGQIAPGFVSACQLTVTCLPKRSKRHSERSR